MDVSGGSTDNHTMTGLQTGASYALSIVGTSEHFSSEETVEVNVSLGELSYTTMVQLSFYDNYYHNYVSSLFCRCYICGCWIH